MKKPSPWPFILIALVAIAARGVAFRGFAASDDADYARTAHALMQGQFPPPDTGVPPHYPTRLGVIAPVALFFRLFGVNEFALLLLPMLMSAASLALVYALGRELFSHRVGLVAMLIYAVMPIDCQYATWLLSDVPGSFWAGAGLLALLLGARRDRPAHKALAGAVAAACFGASWLTRTQVAHLAPFVLGLLVIWTWRDRRNAWLAGATALGAALIFLAEGVLYQATVGDFFHTFHAAERTYALHAKWFYFKERSPYGYEAGRYGWGLARRLLKMGPEALLLNVNLALVPLVALVAVAHAARWRRTEFLFAGAWFVWAALIFNFGSASLKHYEPLPWMDPYLVPVLIPAVLVAAAWLCLMFANVGDTRLLKERRFWAALAALAIAFGAAAGLYQHHRQGIGAPGMREAAEMLKMEASFRQPHANSDALYTDAMTLRGLPFFFGYRDLLPLHSYDGLNLKDIPPRARILINPGEIQRLRDQTGYTPPPWIATPPSTWIIEKRWPHAVLYRVQ